MVQADQPIERMPNCEQDLKPERLIGDVRVVLIDHAVVRTHQRQAVPRGPTAQQSMERVARRLRRREYHDALVDEQDHFSTWMAKLLRWHSSGSQGKRSRSAAGTSIGGSSVTMASVWPWAAQKRVTAATTPPKTAERSWPQIQPPRLTTRRPWHSSRVTCGSP
jgi:hypothetical protein